MGKIFFLCIFLSHIVISALSLKITLVVPTSNAPTMAQANWQREKGDPNNTSLRVVDISASRGPLVTQSFLLPASMISGSFKVTLKSSGTFQLQGVSLQNSKVHVFVSSNTIHVLQSGSQESMIGTISESLATTLPTFTSTMLSGTSSVAIVLNATPISPTITSRNESAGPSSKVIVGAVLGATFAFVSLMTAIFFIRRRHRLWLPGVHGQGKRSLSQRIIPQIFQRQVNRMSQSSILPLANSGFGADLPVIVQRDSEKDSNRRPTKLTIQIPPLTRSHSLATHPSRTFGHIQSTLPNHIAVAEVVGGTDDSDSTCIVSPVSRRASRNTDLAIIVARNRGRQVINRSSVASPVSEKRRRSSALATKLPIVPMPKFNAPIPEPLRVVKKSWGKAKDGTLQATVRRVSNTDPPPIYDDGASRV